MKKFFRKCIFSIIILILCCILAILGYLTFVDSNSTKAKNYLLEKYEINDKDWHALKYTEYIYEDIADCNSLWLKKCTSNKELQFKYTFINKQKEKIIVSEYLDGTFSDESTGNTPLKEKEIPEDTTLSEEETQNDES